MDAPEARRRREELLTSVKAKQAAAMHAIRALDPESRAMMVEGGYKLMYTLTPEEYRAWFESEGDI